MLVQIPMIKVGAKFILKHLGTNGLLPTNFWVFLSCLEKKFGPNRESRFTFAPVLLKRILIQKGWGTWPFEALATLRKFSFRRRCQFHSRYLAWWDKSEIKFDCSKINNIKLVLAYRTGFFRFGTLLKRVLIFIWAHWKSTINALFGKPVSFIFSDRFRQIRTAFTRSALLSHFPFFHYGQGVGTAVGVAIIGIAMDSLMEKCNAGIC